MYEIIQGDVVEALQGLRPEGVQCCVTSPPYWGLRDYGTEGQIGLEQTPQEYVEKMVEVFGEVRRVLRDDGTLWLNIGDSYSQGGYDFGMKPKDLCLIPYRLILALQDDGWWVRSQIVWAKKSAMPESVRDRPTSAWEPIFLLTKSQNYYYDAEAVRKTFEGVSIKDPRLYNEGATRKRNSGGRTDGYTVASGTVGNPEKGANLRNVWHLGPEPFPDAHFATFPTEIPRRAIKAGTSAKGCCPECGTPWERAVERNGGGDNLGKRPDNPRAGIRGSGLSRPPNDAGRLPPTTTGWLPTCDHALDPVPCTVLDPFLGSGTTCVVANQLERDSIGIELSPEYAEMAEKRIQGDLSVTRRKNTEGTQFTLQMM